MKITIYQNREVYKEESKIGNDSENKVETLEFEFPEEYRDFTKYIEFQIKGEKYVDLIEDNKYVITREVAKYGKIKTQVVLKKNTENDVLIFKSNVFELNVSKSINASENLVNTVGVDLIEKIVTKNNEQDFRLDALEADNTTNKENISNLQNDNTTNKSDIKSLQDDNEVNKTDISNIKQEQTTQNTNISNLQTDNTSNKSKIEALEDKNTEQDTNIQKNTDDIAEINAKNTTQDSLIEELQTKVVNLEAENTSLKNQIPSGEATGNPIHLTDSSNLPCEIAVVGNSEQETREGYNKIKYPYSFINSVNTTIQDDSANNLIVENTTPGSNSYFFIDNINLEANKTYTISRIYEIMTGTKTDETAQIELYLAGTWKKVLLYQSSSLATFTVDTSGKYRIVIKNGNSSSALKVKYTNLMILEGTYTADTLPPYEQYGASPSPDYPSEIVTVGQNGSVEIEVCNGNILDFNVAQNSKVTVNDDGTLTINGAGGFSLNIAPITVKAGVNYYQKVELVSGDVSGVAISSAFMSFAGSNKWISNNNFTEVDLTEDIEKKTIWVNAGATFKDAVIRLWTNTDQSDFIPHQSYTKVLPIQKEFVKIGDVEDTFIKVDGKWYEKHNIDKLILDGTESWEYNSTYSTFGTYGLFNDMESLSQLSSQSVTPVILSNFYKAITWKQMVAKEIGLSILLLSNGSNQTRLYSELTTVEDFKNWLAEKYTNGTPVIVYYILETPELIECTEEQSAILNSFYTYKGITKISVDGIATLKVNYKKDLETIINNLSATSVAE